MMNILIVSATENEILIFKNYVSKNSESLQLSGQKANIDFLITGIGIMFTTYKLTQKLTQKKYDLIINAGIAGAFNKNLKLGDIVNVISETFGDFGIDDNGNFKTMFDAELIDKNLSPFDNGKIINNFNHNYDFINNLQKTSGITVNTVSGDKSKITDLNKKFNTDIETMENIAIFYICKMQNINFIALRAISNYVENRNKKNWKTNLAIQNLNNFLINNFYKI